MPFNTTKFKKTKYQPRTEQVPVPDLAYLFDPGETPTITVQGLTGEQLANANESSTRNKQLSALVDAIASGNAQESAEQIKTALGLTTDKVPDDIAKRIEHLISGMVEPTCTREMAVKLFTVHPIEAYQLSNKILQLTGKGQTPGELRASGVTTPPDSA